MNLRSLDLNLLVVFDAVMAARSVTIAASRLNMTQPSMSHALRRLRDALKDELFLRTPDGMVPTPKAERLAEPIREALAKMREALEDKTVFIPSEAEQRFVIVMNNRAALTLAPPLASSVAAQAPGILLDIRPSGTRNVFDQLDRGDVHLAIGGLINQSGRFKELILLEDRYVAVVRKNHRLAHQSSFSMAEFAALPHLVLSSTGEENEFVDEAMSKHGLERRVILHTPLLAASATLQRSDMIAVMSERAAETFAKTADIELLQLPFNSPVLRTTMLWHRRFDVDPGHQWLRNTVVEIAGVAVT